MAFTVVNANIARQKAYNAVYATGTGTSTNTVSPYHFYAIKAFFLFWAANKNNADIILLPYTAEQATTDLGVDLAGQAGTLYVWYAKGRRTSGTTASFGALHDAASNAATTTTLDTARFNASGQAFLTVHPNGMPFATGLTISHATAVGGATESSAADASDGFVIVTA